MGPGSIICTMLDVSAHDYFGKTCQRWKSIAVCTQSWPLVFLYSHRKFPHYPFPGCLLDEQRFFYLARKYTEAAEKLKKPFQTVRYAEVTSQEQMLVTVQFFSKTLRILDITAPASYKAPQRQSWYSFSGASNLEELVVRNGQIYADRTIVSSIIYNAPNLKRVSFIRTDFFCPCSEGDDCSGCAEADRDSNKECDRHDCNCRRIQDDATPFSDWCGHTDYVVKCEKAESPGDSIHCDMGFFAVFERQADKPLDSLTFRDCASITPVFITTAFTQTALSTKEINLLATGKETHVRGSSAGYFSRPLGCVFRIYINQWMSRFSCNRLALENDARDAMKRFPVHKDYSLVVYGLLEQAVDDDLSFSDRVSTKESSLAWNPSD
jgi:hypothetical protein